MKTETEIFIVALVVFVWFLSAWEALAQLSRGRVRRILSGLKNKNLADKVEKWAENRSVYLTVFRILTSCALAVATVFAFLYVIALKKGDSTPLANAAIAVISTFIIVLLAEIIASVLVAYFDLLLLRLTMPVIEIFRYSVLYPVIALVNLIESRMDKWQQNNTEEEKTTTEDEIMSWVEKDDEDGEGPSPLEENERRMIRGVFDLDDTQVKEIMTPRVDLESLNMNLSLEEAKKKFIESGHSRIPIYHDNVDEIRGILYAKDFLNEANFAGNTLDQMMHKPLFIPETKAVGGLLDELKNTQNHLAVVIDEYGGTAGIVTMEDIIEEIFGEIRDEYDSEDDKEPEPVTLPDGSVIFDARTLIDDVNDLMDLDLPENEDVDTIGGFVCGHMGKIPEEGEETLVDEHIHITVLKADNRKISELKLKVLPSKDD